MDDLCDMMRSKATCKDGQIFHMTAFAEFADVPGKAVLSEKDAQKLFTYNGGNDQDHEKRMRNIEQRAGIAGGVLSQPWTVPK